MALDVSRAALALIINVKKTKKIAREEKNNFVKAYSSMFYIADTNLTATGASGRLQQPAGGKSGPTSIH